MPRRRASTAPGKQRVESCMGPRFRGDDVGVRCWVNAFGRRALLRLDARVLDDRGELRDLRAYELAN